VRDESEVGEWSACWRIVAAPFPAVLYYPSRRHRRGARAFVAFVASGGKQDGGKSHRRPAKAGTHNHYR